MNTYQGEKANVTLTIPGQQRWNEKTEEFVYTPARWS